MSEDIVDKENYTIKKILFQKTKDRISNVIITDLSPNPLHKVTSVLRQLFLTLACALLLFLFVDQTKMRKEKR